MNVVGNKPDIEARTYRFAVAIASFCEYHDVSYGAKGSLYKQLLRSGTSVGANVQEAQGGQSKADFLSKMSIAHKEAKESKYWLGVLMDSEILKRGYELAAVCNGTPHKQLTSPLDDPSGNLAGHSEDELPQAGRRVRVFSDRYLWKSGVGVVDVKLGRIESRERFAEHWKRALRPHWNSNRWDSNGLVRELGDCRFSLLSDAQLLHMEAEQLCRILGAIVSKTRRNVQTERSNRPKR
jgi:four helix bundle protein